MAFFIHNMLNWTNDLVSTCFFSWANDGSWREHANVGLWRKKVNKWLLLWNITLKRKFSSLFCPDLPHYKLRSVAIVQDLIPSWTNIGLFPSRTKIGLLWYIYFSYQNVGSSRLLIRFFSIFIYWLVQNVQIRSEHVPLFEQFMKVTSHCWFMR